MKTRAITVNAAVISHLGCVRSNNEDNFYFDGDIMRGDELNTGAAIKARIARPSHLFGVCDGMGGLNGGEYAAAIGVKALHKLAGQLEGSLSSSSFADKVRGFAMDTSKAIFEDGKRRDDKKQGTTLAMLLIDGGVASVANVGDSRVYLFRMGKLVQASRDHTTVFTQLLQGKMTREQTRKHPTGNMIYQYMGMPQEQMDENFMYYRDFSLCNGDRFIICSDGISDLITHEQMEDVAASNTDPMDVAAILISRALELGGKDNATCIVGDISASSLPFQTPSDLAALDIVSNWLSSHETTAR